MYTGLKHFHSYWAYLVLIALVIAFVNALIGVSAKKDFTSKDRMLSLLALIASHTQLLFGIVLYFVSPITESARSNMGTAMKDSTLRLYALEHPLVMLISIILITVGFSKAKKLSDSDKKFRTIMGFYGLALLFVLSRIPWNAWLN